MQLKFQTHHSGQTLCVAQKRDTPERMSLQYAHDNKALQRRVIRVSETFEESRSSGDARPEQGEWSVCP